jgi:hypothetical protein
MARLLSRLSARFCQSAKARSHPYPDGGNLYLSVTADKAGEGVNKSWLFIYEIPGSGNKAEGRRGKRRNMGLGSFPDVSVAEAREEAKRCRALLREALDPLDDKRKRRQAEIAERAKQVTFKAEAEAYIALHSAAWTKKFTQDWHSTLRQHAYRKLGDLAVSEITQGDVFDTVQKIWTTRTRTAERVLSRIERVLDYAAAQGHRTGDNPAAHTRESLPAARKIAPVRNFKALPFEEIPGLMARLREEADDLAAITMQFLILTAARRGDVLHADWSEIDLTKRLWIIPAGRMKTGRQHRVPLSDEALALLKSPLPAARPPGFLKKGWKPAKPAAV